MSQEAMQALNWRYPGDYTLFDLGEFDEETATFTLSSTPISLGVAVEFVKS